MRTLSSLKIILGVVFFVLSGASLEARTTTCSRVLAALWGKRLESGLRVRVPFFGSDHRRRVAVEYQIQRSQLSFVGRTQEIFWPPAHVALKERSEAAIDSNFRPNLRTRLGHYLIGAYRSLQALALGAAIFSSGEKVLNNYEQLRKTDLLSQQVRDINLRFQQSFDRLEESNPPAESSHSTKALSQTPNE